MSGWLDPLRSVLDAQRRQVRFFFRDDITTGPGLRSCRDEDSRPLAVTFSSQRSSTSSTGLRPWRRPATRTRSGS